MYDPKIHHRRSVRLRGYDYSRPGAYFVTICAHDQRDVFGQIVDGEMHLNDTGQMVQTTWMQVPQFHPGCEVDSLVVMPDHIHGIIFITPVGAGPRARPVRKQMVGAGPRPRPVQINPQPGQAQGPAPTLSLADLIHRFKSLTTTRCRRGSGCATGRPCQRNYYEHVIRNEVELQKIREYIATNPVQWETDWQEITTS